MKILTAGLLAVVGMVISSAVPAHGGHGATPSSGITHFLVEPFHVLTAFFPLALVATTVWAMRRRQGHN